MRVLPVVVHDFTEPFDDLVVVDFDGEFTAANRKLPGVRLMDPMMARAFVGERSLPCSLRCFSLWMPMPTSS